VDHLVQFPHCLPQLGVEMIFNAVIRPKVAIAVPSRYFLGDGRPLVADLLVQLEQHFLLFLRPLRADDRGIEVVVVSAYDRCYLSRHCLPVRPWILNSCSIIRAMLAHFFSRRSSRRWRRILSSSSLHTFLSGIYNIITQGSN
jgi:hypothetical protein